MIPIFHPYSSRMESIFLNGKYQWQLKADSHMNTKESFPYFWRQDFEQEYVGIFVFIPQCPKELQFRNQMPLVYRPHSQHPSHSFKREAPSDGYQPSSQSSSLLLIKKEPRDTNEGRWQDGENLKFAVFMAYYQDIFASSHKRKHSKIFKNLAEYLCDRTAPQCRSHFQKLLVKYRTAAKIKKHFRNTFGERIFDLALERFKAQWEQNHMLIRRGALGVRDFREVAVQTEEMALKEEPSFQGINEGLSMHPFAWGMPKMETQHHPYYYLQR